MVNYNRSNRQDRAQKKIKLQKNNPCRCDCDWRRPRYLMEKDKKDVPVRLSGIKECHPMAAKTMRPWLVGRRRVIRTVAARISVFFLSGSRDEFVCTYVCVRTVASCVCLFGLKTASLLACTLGPLKAKNNKRNHFQWPCDERSCPRSRRQWLDRRRKEVPHLTPTSLVSCSTRTRRLHTASSGGGAH
jgi:hypothetical protein